jgi:hypothetical protein
VAKKGVKTGQVQVKVKNENLPAGCRLMWCPVYVLRYLQFVARYNEPWIVDDQEAVMAMQKVWNAMYPLLQELSIIRRSNVTLRPI